LTMFPGQKNYKTKSKNALRYPLAKQVLSAAVKWVGTGVGKAIGWATARGFGLFFRYSTVTVPLDGYIVPYGTVIYRKKCLC